MSRAARPQAFRAAGSAPSSAVGSWLLVLASWTFIPGALRAEDVLVVPVGGDASEAERGRLVDAVASLLRAEGFDVAVPADLVHRVPPSRLASSSASVEQASRLASELAIARLVCVSAWSGPSGLAEVALSFHALGEGRSIRSATAGGEFDSAQPLDDVLAPMIARLLASEREAALLDPGTTMPAPRAQREQSATASVPIAETRASPSEPAGAADAPTAPRRGPEPLFGILGPGLLAAIGAAGVGLGVWASLDPSCELRGATTGVCLRGEENNLGVGILLIATGALSLAGAVVWWITDAQPPPNEPRIDVVLGPSALGLRGWF